MIISLSWAIAGETGTIAPANAALRITAPVRLKKPDMAFLPSFVAWMEGIFCGGWPIGDKLAIATE